MCDYMKELNLKNSNQIPNSYIHKAESESTKWMNKRGKGKTMQFYSKDQID